MKKNEIPAEVPQPVLTDVIKLLQYVSSLNVRNKNRQGYVEIGEGYATNVRDGAERLVNVLMQYRETN